MATDVKLEEFNEVMNTNVTGVLSVTQAFVPLLKKSDAPRVINISSQLGSMASSPGFSTTSYQCSKAALNMLTKCCAFDIPEVVFVSVHPGWVQTDMGQSKNRKAPVSIEDSASGIFKYALEVPKEKSGCFIGFDGKSIEY